MFLKQSGIFHWLNLFVDLGHFSVLSFWHLLLSGLPGLVFHLSCLLPVIRLPAINGEGQQVTIPKVRTGTEPFPCCHTADFVNLVVVDRLSSHDGAWALNSYLVSMAYVVLGP